VTFLVILIVGIVKLAKKTPSIGWGIAALVSGALIEVPMLATLVVHPSPLHIFSLLGGALLYVGVRNVQLAKSPPASLPVPEILPPRDLPVPPF
jgi:hypothetical protein